MFLNDLYYHISTTKEIAVVGREFSAYGNEYALVGLVNTDKSTELVLLEYIGQTDYDCCDDFENMTNRENIIAEKDIHKGLCDILKEIEICGKKYNTIARHGCMLDGFSDGEIYKISEFIKRGWKSEKFFEYPPDCVFIHFVELSEKIDRLSQIDFSQQIRLVAYETYKEEIPMIKLELEVDKELDKTVSLFDGEDKVCIKKVHLVDISKEKNIGKEFASKICPKGMRIPVIEYTCDSELGIQISLSSYLDSLYGESYNGFETEDGVCTIFVAISATDDSVGVKSTTVQHAVKADTKLIECEIERCSKEIENPHIEEFLI